MSKALFFHLRKQIKTSLGSDFGAGKSLVPDDNFNHNGKISYRHGDFSALIEKLQTAVGQAYIIVSNEGTGSVQIKRSVEGWQ